MDKRNQNKKQQLNKQICPYSKSCGGCKYIDGEYKESLKKKQATVERLIGKYCTVKQILGMKNPYHYRNKVNAAFARTRKGQIVSGMYEAKSHQVVNIDSCFFCASSLSLIKSLTHLFICSSQSLIICSSFSISSSIVSYSFCSL